MSESVRYNGWSIGRLVPLLAGTFVLISTVLTVTSSPWWLILTTLVGANLLLYSAVGWCPVTLLLQRLGVPAHTAADLGTRSATSASAHLPAPKGMMPL
ncbi:DUF2892 domain-containing protein [Nocardia sp. 004]|uniref:YgaP family membrane protein n=1 Tax=Nocardia sp. 004 TaxID=3385978 RepID=UPI0039A3CADF